MSRPLLTAALVLLAAPAFAQDGWISLFNGQDLSGWRITENGKWRVEDGAIVANGPRSHLFHERELTDFVFEAEVKTTPGSNSGIFIHTKYQEESWPVQGHEVQVNVSFEKDPVKSGSLYNRVKLFETPMKDGEWTPYRITVKGKTVRVEVAGKLLYEYVQPAGISESYRVDRGVIALQAHDPESVVYYRNLRVKPLDGK